MKKTKAELINRIVNNMRTWELEALIPRQKDDTPYEVALKIETAFSEIDKPTLEMIYKEKIRAREKWDNIGLII